MPEITQPLPTERMAASSGQDEPLAKPPIFLPSLSLGISFAYLFPPESLAVADSTPFASQKSVKLMTVNLHGGGEKEDVCCGINVRNALLTRAELKG